jgi:hypothetical protein
MTNLILQQIVNRLSPQPEDLVKTLLDAEKTAKKQKKHYSLQQLCGTWRLHFVTGTKKTRKQAGVVLGAGRYLPKFIKIQIRYSANSNQHKESPSEMGNVENSVEFAGLQLILTGPIKFLAAKNILAFDFTRITVRVGGLNLYQGYIRGGERKEKEFEEESIKKQAFFSYFLLDKKIIAARGRGGGLALWCKSEV